MRCEQAGECGNNVAAAGVLDGGSQFLRLCSVLNHAQVVAQPLDQGAAHCDRAFQSVDGSCVANLVGDGGQQAVVGEDGLAAGVHEHEVTGTVGVLRHALLEASLTEGCSLLVAQDTRDGGACEQTGCAAEAVHLGGGLDFGQHAHGDTHVSSDLRIPFEGADVHQQGTGCVGDVGDVNAAVNTTGQVPDQPGVGVAEEQVAALCALAYAFNVVQDPLDLGAGEVGGEVQADDVVVLANTLFACELFNDFLGAGVLPDDCVVDGLAGVLVPHDGGFTLVGDADCSDFVVVDFAVCHSHCYDLTDVLPNLGCVVLDPAGLGEDLLVLELALSHVLARLVEQDRAGAGGALVDGEDVLAFDVEGCGVQRSRH